MIGKWEDEAVLADDEAVRPRVFPAAHIGVEAVVDTETLTLGSATPCGCRRQRDPAKFGIDDRAICAAGGGQVGPRAVGAGEIRDLESRKD